MPEIIITADVETRFWAKVETDHTTGCWLWIASRNSKGYGRFNASGRIVMAHRAALAIKGIQVPDGKQIDHLCRVRACVNPQHLEVVTPRINTRRGRGMAAINARKTHCVRGHSFTPANTGYRSGGRRYCIRCASNAASRQTERRAERARDGHICSVAHCVGELYARGYCQPHYRREASHGTPTGGRSPRPRVSDDVTRAILKDLRSGQSQHRIALVHGVGQSTVSRIAERNPDAH